MFNSWTKWEPQALSILRILIGLFYLQHGLSKYFGFPAPPPTGFTTLSLLGLAGIIEIVGSLLLLVGLYAREAAFVMSGEMAVAYFMLRPRVSFFPLVNRGELEALLCLVFFYLVFAGPGPWSIDATRLRGRG